MNVRISVVVCTLNRSDYLRKALQSLVNQTLPRDGYEIVVVDNGSTDNTKQVVSGEFGAISNLRYVWEPVLGLSRARNTGWRSAKGEYVAYLDDDAIASPQWIEKILDVFETVKPRPGCVGGKVEPIWQAPRPIWLPDTMISYLTVVSWSDTPITLEENQWLAGANMAIPRSLLETIGGFDHGLDRKGTKLLSMGDVVLQRELVSKGYHCLYHPLIEVKHHISPSRLTKSWFARRVYWQGVSDAVLCLQQEKPSPVKRLWMGVCVVRQQLVSRRKLLALSVPSHSPDDFALKCFVIGRFGYVLGLWGLAR